jgi:hypothetical protein
MDLRAIPPAIVSSGSYRDCRFQAFRFLPNCEKIVNIVASFFSVFWHRCMDTHDFTCLEPHRRALPKLQKETCHF